MASRSKHMPQLDGLRALAVVAVAISHWTPNYLAGIVPWGTGVQLFFVLSGFLITGILLRSRPSESGATVPQALRVFYARRVLRIFPVYYGVLAVSLIAGAGPIEETWRWHVPYLSNIYFAWHGHGGMLNDPFLHLWSLSVEEQFYLLWPLVIFATGRRGLFVVLIASVVMSMAFRVAVAHWVPGVVSARYLTPSCLDALAVGGLIAYARHYHGERGMRVATRQLGVVGGIGLAFSLFLLGRFVGGADAHRIGHTFMVIFYGAIVAQAAGGFSGVPGMLLNLQPVRYLGRISYGLYVYHYFAPVMMNWLAGHYGFEAAMDDAIFRLCAFATFTVLVAAVSWHLYELPINKLKRHFPYPQPEPMPPVLPPAVAPMTRA